MHSNSLVCASITAKDASSTCTALLSAYRHAVVASATAATAAAAAAAAATVGNNEGAPRHDEALHAQLGDAVEHAQPRVLGVLGDEVALRAPKEDDDGVEGPHHDREGLEVVEELLRAARRGGLSGPAR